jgi:H+/Cl- antiporter ClcA
MAGLTKHHAARLRRMGRLPLVSPRLWLRRFVFWLGAVLVAVVAIGFASAADSAGALFHHMVQPRPWLVFILAPGGLALCVAMTRSVFPGAQGSGIPQVIAALHMTDQGLVRRVLSARIAAGKILLTLIGLACGASIGREGPTVQVGATIMQTLGQLLRLPRVELQRALVLAGGAAGVSAAFNTPLAGVVFAIEELSHSFESRTSGTVFTAVIIGGAVVMGLSGNYTYFGHTSAQLLIGPGWMAVVLCSVLGGVLGGGFSALLVQAANGLPGFAGRFVMNRPVVFAALCGLGLAILGVLSGGTTYGTGYAEARGLVEGASKLPMWYPLLKLAATALSYISGIPGGIFAPSLAIGAGIGSWVSIVIPSAPVGAVVLLGMVGYFSGVVQAPITSAVIVMEMTDNQAMTIPLMATAFLSFAISRLVCRRPLYGALARRFLHAQHHHRPADQHRPVDQHQAVDQHQPADQH